MTKVKAEASNSLKQAFSDNGDGSFSPIIKHSSDPDISTITTVLDGTGNNGKILAASVLTTALTGTNNDLVFTAKTQGIAGDAISVEYVDPGGTTADLSVVLTDKKITINLARAADAITTIASDIITAVGALAGADDLVAVTNSGADDGTGVVTAMAEAYLAGGSDGTVALFTVAEDGLVAIVADCLVSLTGDTATIEVGITGSTAGLFA